MIRHEVELASEEATARVGEGIARHLAPGDLVLLEGELGAGKTTMARALVHGLGVAEDTHVTSPTFALVHEYSGRCPILHADLYRLGDPRELEELGLLERIGADAIVLVEWGERFVGTLGAPTLVLRLAHGADERVRKLVLEASDLARFSTFPGRDGLVT